MLEIEPPQELEGCEPKTCVNAHCAPKSLVEPLLVPGQADAVPPKERMAQRISQTLGKNPDLAFEFYCTASEIVDDFEDYGPVLQANEDGEYSEETVIKRLQRLRNELIRIIDRA